MTTKRQILELIYESMDEIRDMIDDEVGNFKKEPSTQLYGQDSVLDSMATVGLIVAIEEKVNKKLNKTITLANEKAVSAKNSPFKTVNSLADYIIELINE